MNQISEDFIAEFHNIPGETVKEKRGNLFELFRRFQPAFMEDSNQLDFVSKNLNPNDNLEIIFRLDFLIYFGRFHQLYEEFLSGDRLILRKLSKQQWFFHKAFKDLEVDEFVNDVLPTMPYVAKLKIMRRLSYNEEKTDEVFDAVYQKYGLYMASLLLTKCSIDKIREVFQKFQIRLNAKQLKIIYNKDPNLIGLYIEEGMKHCFDMDKNPILVYIAQKNPEMFADLYNKYKFRTHLGRKTTKIFVKSQKHHVLADFESYFKILHTGSLVRILGPELKQLFFKFNEQKK